jgi:hypothetical protein
MLTSEPASQTGETFSVRHEQQGLITARLVVLLFPSKRVWFLIFSTQRISCTLPKVSVKSKTANDFKFSIQGNKV